MIDLRYNLSLLAYKLKNKLNRKKDGDEEEDFNGADNYREDFTDDDDAAPDSYSDEETPEDGDIVIPDDEDDEGSQAKMLRRKHILLAAGAVLFVGAGAMAYSSMNPTTAGGNKEAKKSLSQNVAQTQDTDLPTKYSDISKYQKNGKNSNGKTSAAGATNGQATPPSSGYGNGTSSSSSSPSSSGSSNRTYNTQQPAVSRSSAPRASASAPSAVAAPRATATVTSSPAPAQPQMSAEEKAALKAEQDAKKAESDAMNSSIAFKIAQTVTQAVTGAGTAQAAEPKAPGASSFNVTPYAQNFVDSSYSEFGGGSGSMYTLQAGTVIPATLQTGITSDSPNGDCIAIVRQDVYDSLTGTHLLIPQGAKIIGKYGESGARGNHRIGVAFSRIILPDGRSINLPNQNAIDGTGMPGLAEKYTNHTGSLFKTAFMTALLGSAAQSATGNTSGDDNRSPGQEAVSGAVAQVMQTASQILNREGNTSPTITISPGHAFNIFINQDLSLGEYDE
jgi:type IV secretory pathway VirB10-like protein